MCCHADAILGQNHHLTILSESLLPQAHLPQMSRTRAAVHSTNLSPSPAETQDQLGLIKKEIRSLQEQLPLLDVEENVGTFLSNATSVLEKYREPTIGVDWLRWARGCWTPWLPCLERLTLFILQLLELGLAQ